jgi:endonuclease/exonuclease/phosphatase family metal-dependent hydrolase
MRIITCNVRTSKAKDGDNSWRYRKELLVKVLRFHIPQIICFQELSDDQFLYIKSSFSDFSNFGITIEPLRKSVLNAIFFDKSYFDMISGNGYWLSETPHFPGTKSWDSQGVRFANWVVLNENSSGKMLRIINTHLDHMSQEARENQGKLIIAESNAFPSTVPQVLTGDMNCRSDNTVIDAFKMVGWKDTYESANKSADPGPTFHGFLGDNGTGTTGKIDWIFARGSVEVHRSEIIRDHDNDRYPSDHYFVSADFTITTMV